MIRIKKWFSISQKLILSCFTLFCFVVGSPSSTAEPAWKGAPDCAKDVDIAKVETLLTRKKGDVILETFGFYSEPCNGNFYLLDLQHQKKMWFIAGWWLESIESVRWEAPGKTDAIVVVASYVTGIGPTGAQPFSVQTTIRNKGNEWVVTEEKSLDTTQYARSLAPGSQPQLQEVQTVEAFEELEVSDFGQPVWLKIDFEQKRFVIGSVWLTSGSIDIKKVKLFKSPKGYVIHYKTTTHKMGTTDMKHSTVYAVLPKDNLPVEISSKQPKDGELIKAKVGFIDRGNFVVAPSL